VAIAQLGTDHVSQELIELSGLEHKVTMVLETMASELHEAHMSLVPAVLCSYAQLGWNVPDQFMAKAKELLVNPDGLEFASKVMLQQCLGFGGRAELTRFDKLELKANMELYKK
jgi:hypothetical protein